MSRQLRIQYPGAFLHVTSRGNEQRDIFLSDADRHIFLELLGKAVERYRWIVTAYVLMTNHFHLLIELTAETLSSGMEWLNGRYPQTFNRKYRRVGHLYQGPFDSQLIEKETYHLNVLRYIVLNPVRAGMVKHPADYKWSSYRATAGLDPAPEWLDTVDALRAFGDDRSVAEGRYRRFIDDYDGKCPWNDLVGEMYLGTEQWLARTRERVEGRLCDAEHPFKQRQVKPVEFVDVVATVASVLGMDAGAVRASRGGDARLLTAWLATRHCRLPLTATAAGLRIRSSGRVSTLATECEAKLRDDARLREWLAQCRELLYLM